MQAKIKQMKRRAFTMIELVMVIVILGIVSMIATDVIAKMYKGYIQSKIINDLEQKTETVIDQIAKRLQYRIKPTIIARQSGHNTYLALNSDELNSTSTAYDMVEWIGYDNESFMGEHNGSFSVPGWSGFIDVDSGITSNALNQLKSPGSDLDIIERTVGALSDGAVSLVTAGKDRPAVIFKCPQGDNNLSKYGWDWTRPNLADHNYTLAVIKNDVTTFGIVNPADANRSICEQYYLAWSAYALVPEGDVNNTDDFNLTLRYNYQPWYGEKYTDGNKSVLAEHVSTFRVMQVGETLRVKICIQDGNITGEPVGFCKERAIF